MEVPQSQITTPTKFVHGLCTPPSEGKKKHSTIRQIVDLLIDISQGSFPSASPPFEVFRVEVTDFLEIKKRCEEQELDIYSENLRLDYDAFDSELVIYMIPSKVHEEVLWGVTSNLICWIEKLKTDHGKKAEFARKLRFAGQRDVKVKKFDADTLSSKSPDAQIKHIRAKYPGVVIEIAHREREEHATKKAKDYIGATNANVRAVLVIYTKPDARTMEAKFSIWRPQVNDGIIKAFQAVAGQVFRDADGKVVPNVELQLNLRDFANPTLVTKLLQDEDETFTLSGEELCEILEEAEASDGEECEEEVLKPDRSPSPVDKLSKDDRAKFQALENDAEKRAEAEDEDFPRPRSVPPSSTTPVRRTSLRVRKRNPQQDSQHSSSSD
ncbi:hypothetical protein IQ07DRAFT_596626 [Pyrenochaeta sp. DS3sAY3a]|nr:hypothetical protein IQ07DRAFT_596626 [Pyrenochaeta sp. DS3sAY3a]